MHFAHPPRVLVLLAAFNGMTYLPAQIASVLEQQGVAVGVALFSLLGAGVFLLPLIGGAFTAK